MYIHCNSRTFFFNLSLLSSILFHIINDFIKLFFYCLSLIHTNIRGTDSILNGEGVPYSEREN